MGGGVHYSKYIKDLLSIFSQFYSKASRKKCNLKSEKMLTKSAAHVSIMVTKSTRIHYTLYTSSGTFFWKQNQNRKKTLKTQQIGLRLHVCKSSKSRGSKVQFLMDLPAWAIRECITRPENSF